MRRWRNATPTMPPHYKLAVTLTWLGKYTAVGNEVDESA